MEKEKNSSEQLPILSQDWELIEEMILSSEEAEALKLNDRIEIRFSNPSEHEFSFLISFDGLDAIHFCWKEVDGCFDIDHRLVNPRFRGNGYATKMLNFLMNRCQRLANKGGRQLFMMDTHKESIVRLAKKVGMQLTKGQMHYEQFQKHPEKFSVLDDSTIVGPEGYALNLRMTKIIEPVSHEVQEVLHEERAKIFQLFTSNRSLAA